MTRFQCYGQILTPEGLKSLYRSLNNSPWKVELEQSGHDFSESIRLYYLNGDELETEPLSANVHLFNGFIEDEKTAVLSFLNSLSAFFSDLKFVHRFELYEDEELISYLNYQWPQGSPQPNNPSSSSIL